ncbi:Endolytic peptidoglycan transglycosylase RlpA [Rhodoplanes serenus]|uniref:Endolytic peptidoglycan transglycosylase RlpA n=1 Tax=Rhodoplanes serenus TaxID=200615 RepID=A0A3S4B1K8_9BRAD|nr:septal ring lytic transglycosylase RlpA family protein [Rhodoplanes serenus]VCU06850.1 Endolytic peptidoglycan transglycosylase RlpA [Rhodoplanes serenus]
MRKLMVGAAAWTAFAAGLVGPAGLPVAAARERPPVQPAQPLNPPARFATADPSAVDLAGTGPSAAVPLPRPRPSAQTSAPVQRTAAVLPAAPLPAVAGLVPMPRPRPLALATLIPPAVAAAPPVPAAKPEGTVRTAALTAGTVDPRCEGRGRLVRSAFYWQGTRTASGARFDPDGLSAAHRTLPFGTRLTVTNPRNGRSVEVVVNDRGPYTAGLHIDISRGAARAIGLKGTGTVCLM